MSFVTWVTWADDMNLVANLVVIVKAVGIGMKETRINLSLASFVEHDEIDKERKVEEHVMAECKSAGRNI